MDLNWKKLENTAKKLGFADGADAGRNSQYQTFFDSGFKSGFRNGFHLGNAKGERKLISNDVSICAKRGNCIICKDGLMDNMDANSIATKQWKSTISLTSTDLGTPSQKNPL